MSQLQHYDSTPPHVRHVPGYEPRVGWQRRQHLLLPKAACIGILAVLALITLMVAAPIL